MPQAQDLKKDRVIVFDTTLRDGEQSPGASMTFDEKLEVAHMLEEMGVDVIEAGFPAASKGDFESVAAIAARSKKSIIAGLARTLSADIEACAEALKAAERFRIHTFISTSPLHMEYKLKMAPKDVLGKITEMVSLARKYTDDVEWSAEDATRTDHDFLCQAIELAIKAGAKTVNIPDTVGYTTPAEYGALIAMIKNRVPNIDQAVISVHCHNDLGLAVANSLAAISAGARQIECTMNGIGERAGNAALEEVVMAMRTRPDLLPFQTNIKTDMITKASRLVSTVTSFAVQPNKAIVGANAFLHESGIHQHGMLSHAQTYEIMTPESVGLSRLHDSLVLGKLSGRHAFKQKLDQLGLNLGDNSLEDAFHRFKELADRKKKIYDEDIISLVDDKVLKHLDYIQFVSLHVVCGESPQVATLQLKMDGKTIQSQAEGNGPVDAIFNAITAAFPHEAKLLLYQVHAITEGTDAQAEVTVRLDEKGLIVTGNGADPDTIIASARAYIHALNKLKARKSTHQDHQPIHQRG